jgi:decaprenylphospho-beta-D-ribofuranose 2-oxidase
MEVINLFLINPASCVVDSLDPKGRGVLTCGDHAPSEALPPNLQGNPLHYDPKALASAPPFLPGGLLNKLTVRAFNEAWYRKAPKQRVGEFRAIAPFFHPLDGVQDWNRIYGPVGFLQYQFAVPNEAAPMVSRTLEALRQVGAPSFLTVLKHFGPSNPAPLSFPIPGWTLAADVPAAVNGLLEVLDELDEEVVAAGGRIYLAKDTRQSISAFTEIYGQLSGFIGRRESLSASQNMIQTCGDEFFMACAPKTCLGCLNVYLSRPRHIPGRIDSLERTGLSLSPGKQATFSPQPDH